MSRPAPFPWRAAVLGAALFFGLGLAATALEPSAGDDVYAAIETVW